LITSSVLVSKTLIVLSFSLDTKASGAAKEQFIGSNSNYE
jgi:hypothetical protein